MNYADVNGKLADYRRQIAAIREKMRETLASVEPQEVANYEFASLTGPVRRRLQRRPPARRDACRLRRVEP